MTPASPLVASMWPKLVLIEPTSTGESGDLVAPKTDPIAFASIGSPVSVPLPC